MIRTPYVKFHKLPLSSLEPLTAIPSPGQTGQLGTAEVGAAAFSASAARTTPGKNTGQKMRPAPIVDNFIGEQGPPLTA